MFIRSNKEEGFKIYFNKTDMMDALVTGGNIMVVLSAEKAKELEDRLEEVVNPKKDQKGGNQNGIQTEPV